MTSRGSVTTLDFGLNLFGALCRKPRLARGACFYICIYIIFSHGAPAKENRGERPQVQEDFKPMPDVGPGVQEIRIRDEAGIFRVLYVAKFEGAVYVLHCFQKKTQRTAKSDLNVAGKRYAELVKEQKR
jgi:putative component of toxin-antitoxin plasmid stabilization module